MTQLDSALPPQHRQPRISLWVKIPYTLFLCVLIPYYWVSYGPANFLWFCDVALLVTLAALWLENSFLASMQALAIVFPQMLWVVDFLVKLATGRQLIGIAAYMFDTEIPRFVRGLSLFHGWLPFLLLWLIWRLGYARSAWRAQTLLAWALLLTCYFFVPPPPAPPENPTAAVNVNWVFGMGDQAVQTWMTPQLFLILLLVFYPVCIYLPSHLIFRKAFRQPSQLPQEAATSDVIVEGCETET